MYTSVESNLFATTAKGLELLLADELRSLGAKNVREKLAGVTFNGDLNLAYKVCLWSRLANRILLPLISFQTTTPEELYAGVQTINWDEHIDVSNTFAVHCVCSQSAITHSLFAAQKIKDAIVDQLRAKFRVRPSVQKQQPDVSIYAYIHRNSATLYIDLSGESLHKRGYRTHAVSAPIKENLAAAILMRSGWEKIAKKGGALMDPMCGSGTFLIEAAMIAGDIAPGLLRSYFGFFGWKQHQNNLWQELVKEAQQLRMQNFTSIPTIVGYDNDKTAIKIAFENIERANLHGKIHVEKRDLSVFVPKTNVTNGLVIVNPPYGERIGEVEELKPLYTLLGDRLKEHFVGWHAGIFTGNPELGKQMGLRSNKQYALFNGAIPCKLLLFDVQEKYFVDRSAEADNVRRVRSAKRALRENKELGTENLALESFANRLRKNFRHFSRAAKRTGQTQYRVYDADLPDYAFVIDILDQSVQVQEYEAPAHINKEKVRKRQQELLAILPEILGVNPATIFFSVIPNKKKFS